VHAAPDASCGRQVVPSHQNPFTQLRSPEESFEPQVVKHAVGLAH
jgi:hypothetical protein